MPTRFWTEGRVGSARGLGHGLLVSRGKGASVLFPQEGVFNQIVSSDLVELIENHELKSGLFRLYNEDLRRHACTRSSTINSLPFNRRLTRSFCWTTPGEKARKTFGCDLRGQRRLFEGQRVARRCHRGPGCIRNYIKELQFLQGEFQGLRDLFTEVQ